MGNLCKKPVRRVTIDPKFVDTDANKPYELPKSEVKICFLGNVRVGKTLFYMSTMGNEAKFTGLSTGPAGDNSVRHKQIEGHGKVVVIIWDTAGEETYFGVTKNQIRNCDGVMLLYDITDPKTFVHLDHYWIPKIEDVVKPVYHICGNKCDQAGDNRDNRNEDYVQYAEAKEWADTRGYLFEETSAKTKVNIESSVQNLIKTVLDRRQAEAR